ncbi:serine hydrolase domain-containing protein [Ornithinimicrobium cerasi]|uniref:serine hydrolase domain-containing protein n=1 Tax=Ornithinimicrobium cerasi TaxID=2248773 RepID=UPI001142FE18|nr:serine hydrolase domain-containing protein [Ornithinimicrobium cerasi]
MSPPVSTEERVESLLWPFVERLVDSWQLPGVAMCVVHDGDRVRTRGFGARDVRTGDPVTEDTLFHLASVSKTVVATAVLQLVEAGELDLDAGVTAYLPDLVWADPRAEGMTVRHLLSHRSGLGDVSDYGWHEPELDDGALARFAARVAGWTLERNPGTGFAYSNAAYELLGHLVATVAGRPFEDAVRERVLQPVGMTTSTFLRADVPAHLGALPHLGLPPRVVDGAYPYTRRHAPSSTLHSSVAELGRWTVAHLAGGAGLMSPRSHEAMWTSEGGAGGQWHAEMALGWFRGTHRGYAVVSHSGEDPGFSTSLAMVPDRGVGVVVLADSNTAPTFTLTKVALDVLLGQELADPPLPPVTVPLAPVLERSGVTPAAELYRRLAEADAEEVDLDEVGFSDAVWGVIEMHRTDLAWPLLELWQRVQPDSAQMELNTGWAHEIDGRLEEARRHLRRAVELDPDDEEAATMLARLSEGRGG